MDFAVLTRTCFEALPDQDDLYDQLGVEPWTIGSLRVGWSDADQAYTFPMYDGLGNVVGIQRRWRTGVKKAMPGSRMGIFRPHRFEKDCHLVVCEGASDCASVIGLGFQAIGRPSSTGGLDAIERFLKRNGMFREVTVIRNRNPDFSAAATAADSGAEALACLCRSLRRRVRMVRPPAHNDVRSWIADSPSAFKCVLRNAGYV